MDQYTNAGNLQTIELHGAPGAVERVRLSVVIESSLLKIALAFSNFRI